MHSVKLGSLVCAITVHLLLVLFWAKVIRSMYAHLPVCVPAYVPVRVI